MDNRNTPTTAALDALERCRINLRAARVDALAAATHLPSNRADRAAELAGKLTEALAYTDRLATMVAADVRAQEW